MSTSEVTKTHRLSSREKLRQAQQLILDVSRDDQVGPSPFSYLTTALRAVEDAMQFPLNEAETHELRMAQIAEAVPEKDEPPLCTCGKHYIGAPCDHS